MLERLGRLLVAGCNERLERAFYSLGPDMQGLLTSLDGVHDVLQQTEAEKEEEGNSNSDHSFVCSVVAPGELELNFSTARRGVALLLTGSLTELAHKIHGTRVNYNKIYIQYTLFNIKVIWYSCYIHVYNVNSNL